MKRVTFQGVEMKAGWPERILAAQAVTTLSIAGLEHPRIRYGDESEQLAAGSRPCPDCKVQQGQFHVPSCDLEECPSCGGQAIGCDCASHSDGGAGNSARPFSRRELEIVAARQLFTWRHTGFTVDGDATFEVRNGSPSELPFLSVGVRGPNLRGVAWLTVSDIGPGQHMVVQHDCYKDLVRPEEVEFFECPDPTPETRDDYWEFGRP